MTSPTVPPSSASLLSGDLPVVPLDASMEAALQSAARLANGNGQQFAGLEHLLLAILDHEDGNGPGHSFLHTLGTDIPALRRSLAAGMKQQNPSTSPVAVSLRSDCRRILKMADQLRCGRTESYIHSGHVVEAIVCHGIGKTAKWISLCIGIENLTLAKLSPLVTRGLQKTGVALGLAWELPETAEDFLGRMLYLDTWTARSGPWACLQPGLWDRMECYVYHRNNKLRVMLCPSEMTTRFGRWLCRKSVIRKSANLAANAGARQISVPRFLREWPSNLTDFAGSLNTRFFTSGSPSGKLRPLTEADVPFCRELYAHLEQRHQVPAGYSDSMNEWLHEAETLRLAIELDGSIAGCGGFSLRRDPISSGNGAAEHAIACLSFGLVHPKFQRRRLGSTLLAFRMAAAYHLGYSTISAEATSCSVDFLERAGFRFWRTWRSPAGEELFSGAVTLTSADSGMLEEWLGPERLTCLRALTPPPLRTSES